MGRVSIRKQIILGVVLGALLLAVFPQQAQAQWLTFDKPQWLLKLEDMMREVERWEKKVDQYTKMYDKAVKQVERLTNIVDKLDEQLSRNKKLVVTIASVGKMVRKVFELKRKYENIVRCRIVSVQRLWGRLRNGIFDPQQNLRDLEEYLKNSIGRHSEDAVAHMERLAAMDSEFERMRYELGQAQIRLAHAYEVLEEYQKLLEAEKAKDEKDQQAISVYSTNISLTEQLIEQLNKQITDLTEKIAARAERYGMVLKDRAEFGAQIVTTNEGFGAIIEGKKEILEEIDKEFEPDEGIIDDDEWF